MHDVELVHVLDAGEELLQEARGLLLLDAAVRDDVVEELAARRVLHDQVELLVRLDDLRAGEGAAPYFVELHELRVPNYFEDVDFARDALHVRHVRDFVLLEDLDGDLRGEAGGAVLSRP